MNQPFMGDFELLRAYSHRGDEEAFTELVNRHVNLVYSAALRQARDPHRAAEITQSVFMVLARKAATIRKGASLPGWLLITTRHTAANARRREQHRQQLEQQAMQDFHLTETESAWSEIAPLLDEALVTLGERDRDAIALRFFAQKSYKEIGAALSSSEEGARKRVSRAMDSLRVIFTKRGKMLSSGVVAAAITAHATQAAPAGLAGAIAASAIAKAAVATWSLPLLAQGTLQSLRWMPWKTIAMRSTVAGLA